jgi:hypothetical protein
MPFVVLFAYSVPTLEKTDSSPLKFSSGAMQADHDNSA